MVGERLVDRCIDAGEEVEVEKADSIPVKGFFGRRRSVNVGSQTG